MTFDIQDVPKELCPVGIAAAQGAVDLVMSVFAQPHRSGFNIELENLNGSI